MMITEADIAKECKLIEDFYDAREQYRKDLKDTIERYGEAVLPDEVKKTIPADKKVFNELPWRKNAVVRYQVKKLARMFAENAKIEEVLNENVAS